ncbi:MAG: 30S ribosomal protein S9 [Candidatus Omnitrophota bacterium]|nr:30S ribosomal protein S9 [Candidatus Omnitrophota bacterium]MBU1929424.1 30S ribosomal protein S9 [Candidatus Omnitrophota bacterium]MBU2034854.1 30S ribosomal protein S9 [Candidatus Omnitrophota bacterium]
MSDTTRYTAIGRRKEAKVRIQLMPGKGDIVVNHRALDQYFIRETDRIIIRQPLEVTNTAGKYDVAANIQGGGLAGQAGAIRLGIARALMTADPELKEVLRKNGFLTRDPRMKERKKYGQKGARKRFQWTKR